MTEIYLLLAVILGFYLGRFNEVNKKISEKIKEYKASNEPMVVLTDEAELERQQQTEQKSEDKIFLKDIFKDKTYAK